MLVGSLENICALLIIVGITPLHQTPATPFRIKQTPWLIRKMNGISHKNIAQNTDTLSNKCAYLLLIDSKVSRVRETSKKPPGIHRARN